MLITILIIFFTLLLFYQIFLVNSNFVNTIEGLTSSKPRPKPKPKPKPKSQPNSKPQPTPNTTSSSISNPLQTSQEIPKNFKNMIQITLL